MKGYPWHRVARAMTRGFFEGLMEGLCEGTHPELIGKRREAKVIKQLVADHYGEIAQSFVGAVFPLLLSLRFDSYDLAVADLSSHHFDSHTSPKLLLRYACGSKEDYDIVVEAYRQQMECLLLGHIQRPEEFLKSVLEDSELTEENDGLEAPVAIRTVVRAIMQGYAEGIKMSKTANRQLHQQTVLRLMVNGMATLLSEEAVDPWADADAIGQEAVYKRVSINAFNYETLLDEMNQAYADLSLE